MTATSSLQLDHLDSRIRTVWRREQALHLAAGILAFCRWAVLLFFVGVAIDWMMEMPAPARVVVLIALLAVSLYKAILLIKRYVVLNKRTHDLTPIPMLVRSYLIKR